jgi:hypothetical protein
MTEAAAPPRPRVICKTVRTFERWDCITAGQRESAAESRFEDCRSLLTSQASRRTPPNCGAFRFQPRGSPLRQTGCWRKPDSNCWSHLRRRRLQERPHKRDLLRPEGEVIGFCRSVHSAAYAVTALVFAPDRGSQVRIELAGGGKWIRNIGAVITERHVGVVAGSRAAAELAAKRTEDHKTKLWYGRSRIRAGIADRSCVPCGGCSLQPLFCSASHSMEPTAHWARIGCTPRRRSASSASCR